METEKVFLQFGASTQEQIFAWMVSDYTFLLQCIEQGIDFTYFTDPTLSDLVKILLELHTQYKCLPTVEMIKSKINVVHFAYKDGQARVALLDKCLISRDDKTREVIGKEVTAWKQLLIFKRSVAEATRLYNAKNYMKAYEFMREKMEELHRVNFGKDDKIRFDDLDVWVP